MESKPRSQNSRNKMTLQSACNIGGHVKAAFKTFWKNIDSFMLLKDNFLIHNYS